MAIELPLATQPELIIADGNEQLQVLKDGKWRRIRLALLGIAGDGTTTTPPDTTPPPPSPTALIDENWDTGLDGEDVTADSSTADVVTGSGTMKHSSTWNVEGGNSARIFGIAAQDSRYVLAPHVGHFGRSYWRYGSSGSATAWFIYGYAGDHTTVVYRVGIDPTGHLVLQSGVAGTVVTATNPFPVGKVFRLDDRSFSGTTRIVAYGESAIGNDAETGALAVLAVSPAAGTLSDIRTGLLNTLSGGTTIPANLTAELFNGTNGAQITNANTTADRHFGSGTITFSTAYAKEGTSGMRVHGTAYEQIEFDNPSITTYGFSCYLKFTSAPSATKTSYFAQVKDGPNSAVAFQVGIDTAGKLTARNSNTGTGSSKVTATTAFTAGQVVRVEGLALGGGAFFIRYATGANEDTMTFVETLTMGASLTAPNFSQEHLGQVAAVDGSADYIVDRWMSSSTGIPSAVGAGGGANFELFADRFQYDTAAFPAKANVTIGGNPGGSANHNLEPTTGCLFGATAGNATGQSSSSAAGLEIWQGIAGRRPDILHFYKKNSWNGAPTIEERQLLEPVGANRAIAYYTWKIDPTLTKRQIANGAADPSIRAACVGLKAYPFDLMLGFYHEFENDSHGTGDTYADFKAMWIHVHDLMAAEGVTNVVFVLNYMGYSSFAGSSAGANFEAMYPGDSYVGWIAYDPYFDATSRTDLSVLLNENFGGPTGWPGFYDWATATHPSKPIMLGEWSIDFTALTDTQAASRISSFGTMISNYPQLKAGLQWNSIVTAGIDGRLQGHPLSVAAFAALGALPWFNVGVETLAA